MKQVLLIFTTKTQIRYALIPKDVLYDDKGCPIDLKEINGHDVNEEDYHLHGKNIIVKLFIRAGLKDIKINNVEKDLEQYLNPKFPITIDEICYIGWSGYDFVEYI